MTYVSPFWAFEGKVITDTLYYICHIVLDISLSISMDVLKFLWNKFWFVSSLENGFTQGEASWSFLKLVLDLLHTPAIVWSEMKDTDKWQCYDHFRPFVCHMYVHLPQNWGSDGHFELLHWSKLWLVQKLWHKTQIFPFPFFCDFVQNQTFAFFAFLRFVS